MLSTATESMFMSFHAQCNNYLLPRVLDSRLPVHLLSKEFEVELWRERTLQTRFKLHEYARIGKISLSCRYFVVATARRVVRLGGSQELEWIVPEVKHILLHHEHAVFAFTDY